MVVQNRGFGPLPHFTSFGYFGDPGPPSISIATLSCHLDRGQNALFMDARSRRAFNNSNEVCMRLVMSLIASADLASRLKSMPASSFNCCSCVIHKERR